MPSLELAMADEDQNNVRREMRRAVSDIRRRHTEETQELLRVRPPSKVEAAVREPFALRVVRVAFWISVLYILYLIGRGIYEHGLPF